MKHAVIVSANAKFLYSVGDKMMTDYFIRQSALQERMKSNRVLFLLLLIRYIKQIS